MGVMLVKTAVLLPTSQGKFWRLYFMFHNEIIDPEYCICSLRDGLDLVQKAIGRTGYNEKIKIAIGVAATEFCIGDIFALVQIFVDCRLV